MTLLADDRTAHLRHHRGGPARMSGRAASLGRVAARTAHRRARRRPARRSRQPDRAGVDGDRCRWPLSSMAFSQALARPSDRHRRVRAPVTTPPAAVEHLDRASTSSSCWCGSGSPDARSAGFAWSPAACDWLTSPVTRCRVSAADWMRQAEALSAHFGIRRPVDLLLTHSRDTLATWGIWRPQILLPSDALAWECRAHADRALPRAGPHRSRRLAVSDYRGPVARRCCGSRRSRGC